jgi:aromatic-L-amino-acid decarboxylase
MWNGTPCLRVEPGWIQSSLPAAAPEVGEPMDAIIRDFQRVLVPGLTHWNHPGFLGYFARSGSGPGVLAELLTAALNQQAMLGHSQISLTLNTYAHVLPSLQRDASVKMNAILGG